METRPQSRFVPAHFAPPSPPRGAGFVLTPLRLAHNERDLEAWSSSVNHIHATAGFAGHPWPNEPMTLERNALDLQEHEDDFTHRRGFTYSVLIRGTRSSVASTSTRRPTTMSRPRCAPGCGLPGPLSMPPSTPPCWRGSMRSGRSARSRTRRATSPGSRHGAGSLSPGSTRPPPRRTTTRTTPRPGHRGARDGPRRRARGRRRAN
jgi:hypothetical protein